jgi:hypothetical protein
VLRKVYHALGVTDRLAADREGKPFDVMPEGRALSELF